MKKIILVLVILFQFSASGTPLVSNLIEPVKYFVNHEAELSDLGNRLSFYQKAVLLGISGMGKTQLARMYAYKNQDKYDIIWFFDCSTNLNEQYIELARQINKNFCANKQCNILINFKDAKKSVIDYLAPKKDWLLVFDNLKINQNNMLKDIIDLEHNGHIILCSQDSKGMLDVIQLPHFTKNDSLNLANIILNESDYRLVEELVELFKGYPLLVARGAMFLSGNKHITVEEYKKLLNKPEDKIKLHIELVLKQLNPSSQDLLYKIAIMNNQQFSKKLLSNIVKYNDSLLDDLHNLIRFGLVARIDNKNEDQSFEIHDVIKDAILEIVDKQVTIDNMVEVIDKINGLMPKAIVKRHLVFTDDKTLLSNLEVLLNNAEKYKVNIYKVMELRKNIFSFYLNTAEYDNCQKMSDWLSEKQAQDCFKLQIMSDKEKAIYCEYLNGVGVYEDRGKGDYINAMKHITEARNIINGVEAYPERKFTIHAQLAHILAFSGDINAAEKNLEIMNQIIKNNPNTILDSRLFWVRKAQIHLVKGEYDRALDSINKAREEENPLPEDTFTAPTRILQAEILNYMQNFEEAYELGKKLYEQETKNIKNDHEIHAKILIQLSRAELGLGKPQEALEHSKKAKEIYLKGRSLDDKDLDISHNVYLAAACVAEADALRVLEQYNEAIDSYANAETIYYNRYRGNIKYMDDISYLYLVASKAACNLPDKYWYKKFSNQHIEKFGADHFRSQEILKMNCNAE